MLCIECGNPTIDCLYSKYESDYIKLTICDRCGKIADKYIEYDNVILFIDLLLLKQRAYRHLAYNVNETDMLKDPAVGVVRAKNTSDAVSSRSRSESQSQHSFVWRYKRMLRFILLIILFEVYLKWAYEERKSVPTITMHYILNRSVPIQYLYFIANVLIEQIVSNVTILILFRYLLNWGHVTSINLKDQFQYGYQTCVLLSTVLTSSSIKLFPILMLIWPYDTTSISASIINLIGYLYTVEALRIVTNKSYISIIFILIVSVVLQLGLTNGILLSIVSKVSGIELTDMLHSDYDQFLQLLEQYRVVIRVLQDSL
ncbi:Arv1-like family-domain-containing protein [Scheffersomyces amazonensis]|uniref:Arv1-like family-domain-containing protein n=1 Tax=Scheffersomyces amazonensis TaxID=1078765 RepID=UPI00315CEA5C